MGYLRLAIVVVFGLGVAGLLLPEDLYRPFSVAMVIALILVPVTRVGWLIVRWLRLGDVRFALVAVALLVVLVGALALSH